MIAIRTSVVEYGLFRDDYDAFVEALAAEGVRARIDQPEERRFDLPSAEQVGIFLLEAGGSHLAIEAIKRIARATIGQPKRARRSQPLRRLPIYGPKGEVLGWVDLPDESDGAAG